MRLRTQFSIAMALFSGILARRYGVRDYDESEGRARRQAGKDRLRHRPGGEQAELSGQRLPDLSRKPAAGAMAIRVCLPFPGTPSSCGPPEQQALVASLRVNKDRLKEVFASASSALEIPSGK